MSGHGNDFVIVDNWDGQVKSAEMPELVRAVCRRRFGVGADGMVFIEAGPEEVDFGWRFFNADGSEADMCGNAGRCTAYYAHHNGIAPSEMSFMTNAGVINAEVMSKTVKVQLTQPSDIVLESELEIDDEKLTFCSINTGVPHAAIWVDDLENIDVTGIGRQVRFHPFYKPAGVNVNFIQVLGAGRLAVRTYERGVEDETLACGTGVAAAVLLTALRDQAESPTRVLTRGGEALTIYFTKTEDDLFDVFLEGPVRTIYTGRLEADILK